MKMETIVKKYTRPIFAVIVGLLALSLILTFAPGSTGGGSGDQKYAGVLVDGTSVPMEDWDVYRNWSVAFHRLENFHMILERQAIIDAGKVRSEEELDRELKSPSREHLFADAWDMYLVLRRADELGITATKDEVKAEVDAIVKSVLRGDEKAAPDKVNKELQAFCSLDRKELTGFMDALIRYRRTMGLLGFGYLPDFRERPKLFLYPSLESASNLERPTRARLFCATFSPDDFEYLIDPVSAKQIEEEVSHAPLMSEPRARIDFVIADYDAYADRVGAPTDKEIEDHYTKNKESYRIVEEDEHSHDDGHDHGAQVPPKDPKYRPLAEVKEEIRKRLMREKAGASAKTDIENVAREIVKKLGVAKNNDEKLALGKALSLADLATPAKLRYDTSGALAEGDVEALSALLGKPIGDEKALVKRIFDEGAPEGTIYAVPPERTDKGHLIFRIRERFAPVPREMDSDARRVVERRCEEEARDAKARAVADEIGKKMKAGLSFGAAVRSWEAKGVRTSVIETGWFDTMPRELFRRDKQGERMYWLMMNESSIPVEPSTLAERLHGFAAFSVRGSMQVNSIIVPDQGMKYYCAYLEDKVDVPSDDLAEEIRKTRDGSPDLKARRDFLADLMKSIKTNNVSK